MGDLTESSTRQTPATKQPPFREDYWTEEATWTLVEAWGRRYVELNRGNLRHKDWRDVADVVNARHGHTQKSRRTDVQCKNRIDTIKKKYKTEKTKIAESNGALTSSWPFFPRMDYLIGSNFNKHQNSKSPMEIAQSNPLLPLPSPPMAVPLSYRSSSSSAMVTPAILPQKRPMSSPHVGESYFKRNFSAIAAAAAASDDDYDDDDDDDDDDDGESEGAEVEGRGVEAEEEEDEGMGRLTKAIERFGQIYEKVEGMKQRQMVELEKQRMQFAKDLEVQRMQLFMDTQVQLENIKQARRSSSDDVCR